MCGSVAEASDGHWFATHFGMSHISKALKPPENDPGIPENRLTQLSEQKLSSHLLSSCVCSSEKGSKMGFEEEHSYGPVLGLVHVTNKTV